MSESVVADFTTDVIPDTGEFAEPVRGRVVMSDKRVVIATPGTQRTIRISDVFDIAYGSAPPELREFFEDTVTVASRDENGRHVALIEGADDTVRRFTDLLFKAVINGTDVLVRHPARRGGRVTDSAAKPATVFLRPGMVLFKGAQEFTIEASTVSHFERHARAIGGEEREVLSVRHTPEMESVTTEIALDSSRRMNVLGRFLRTEYSQLKEELAQLDISERETEAMVGLYSGGSDASLAGVLGMESNQVTMLLNSLVEKGLVEEGESGMTLTPIGKLAVSSRIEQVNM